MVTKRDIFIADNLKLPELSRGVLAEQLKWLVLLRWFAITGIILAGVICSTVFPILHNPRPISFCAGILLVCNLIYLVFTSQRFMRSAVNRILLVIQLEVDLFVLTLLLHFEQVLLNIFLNALDAMAVKDDLPHQLDISRSHENDMIVIQIKDDGVGMEPEVCRRAFESFFTTKELGKGTGLGLFISHNLVSELDGTIELDSEPGKGTTVTVRIPIRPKNKLISTNGTTEPTVSEL